MTREEAVSKALRAKREGLEQRRAEIEAKTAALQSKNADFVTVCSRLKALGARLALTAVSGKKAETESIKAEMQTLSKARAEMIKNAGIGEIKYDCEKCRDTGYSSGGLCDCVKSAAGEIMLSDLYERTPAKDCSFESFKLSFYEDEKAKKRMSGIFELSKAYAEEFGNAAAQNLLFMGNTGLGKTHLSLAIAAVVTKKGFNALYSPAYNLFAEIETEHFSEHTNKRFNEAVNCDLLIIDDLGGEFVSPYIQSVVYNIINTRIISSKPTIINTNLTMEQISERYTPRVASRLIGEYTAKAFLGKDIRQIKKMK